MVKAWCQIVGLEQPANYKRAVGAAQKIVDAGITAEDLPALYAYVSKWAGSADLPLLERQMDKWLASRNAPKRGPADKPYWQWSEDEIAAELARCAEASEEPPHDLLKAARKYPPQEGRYRNPYAP